MPTVTSKITFLLMVSGNTLVLRTAQTLTLAMMNLKMRWPENQQEHLHKQCKTNLMNVKDAVAPRNVDVKISSMLKLTMRTRKSSIMLKQVTKKNYRSLRNKNLKRKIIFARMLRRNLSNRKKTLLRDQR